MCVPLYGMKTASKSGISSCKGIVKYIERILKDRADQIDYSICCKGEIMQVTFIQHFFQISLNETLSK